MDIRYDIQQLGNNRLLFNETVNAVDPFFLLVLTNPWTLVQSTLHITPEGTDGEWILNIIGSLQSYQDLVGGQMFFDNEGTWEVSIYLNEVTTAALIRTATFQVVEHLIKPPTQLTATSLSASSIELHWLNNSADTIRIERSLTSGGPWVFKTNTLAGVTGFTDTLLISLTEYFYRVRAFDEGKISSFTNESSATTS